MSKSSRKLFSNMYEGEVLDLDYIEELDKAAPVKSNKAVKQAARGVNTTKQPIKVSKTVVLTKPVDATCNKCSGKVVGELISDIYIPHLNKMMPLITYSCQKCGHNGRRSVFSLALPIDQYDRKYFN